MKFLWECWDSIPGLLCEEQICYLSAMQPPLVTKFFLNPDANVSADIVGDLRVDDEPGRLLRHHRPLLLRARPTGSWLP